MRLSPNPNMKARLADLGGTVLAGSPADFGKLIADEPPREETAGERARSCRALELRRRERCA
jgi:hypothetical protein